MSRTTISQHDQTHRYLTVARVNHRPNLEGLQPVGDIDLYTAPMLQRMLDDLDRRAVPGVVIDMSRVDFLAIAGLRVLYDASERAARDGRRVVLANSSSLVRRVLVLTKTLELLDVRDSVADALAELDTPANA
jgi:anti-sigma B factor antagonist